MYGSFALTSWKLFFCFSFKCLLERRISAPNSPDGYQLYWGFYSSCWSLFVHWMVLFHSRGVVFHVSSNSRSLAKPDRILSLAAVQTDSIMIVLNVSTAYLKEQSKSFQLLRCSVLNCKWSLRDAQFLKVQIKLNDTLKSFFFNHEAQINVTLLCNMTSMSVW